MNPHLSQILKKSNMSASWFFDENFSGISDEFFDDVIKHMDFPLEDLEPNEDWNSKFQSIEPPLGLLSDLSSDFYKAPKNNHSTLHNRAPQLKQQSSTADTPSSGSTLLPSDSNDVKDSKRFQSSSPVSVLGSSISCSAENSAHVINPELVFPVKGTRSKRRRRPPTCNLYLIFSFPAYESDSKSHLTEKRRWEKQKLKKNLAVLSGTRETKKPYFEQAIATRKCTHCEVTDTPQWREGPLGPKTLCNACGVRYRSGRLLPEYRPAASPTFVPSVHSNSHKRILEMRNKVMQ